MMPYYNDDDFIRFMFLFYVDIKLSMVKAVQGLNFTGKIQNNGCIKSIVFWFVRFKTYQTRMWKFNPNDNSIIS